MASPVRSTQEAKQEVIDVEEFFGDDEIEITGYRQSPNGSSVRKSRSRTRKRQIIEIPDDDELMLIDQPVTAINQHSPAIAKKRRNVNIASSSSKVVVEVPHIKTVLADLKRRVPNGHDSDSEGTIDYDTWMGVEKINVVDPVPSEFDLGDIKEEFAVRERLQVRLDERLMYRPESSKNPRQRASRLPHLWNFSDVKTFNQQKRRPNELEVPFTAPGGRTAHLWNPKRRVTFHSSLNIPSLHVVGRYTKTSGMVTKVAQSNGLIAVASAASGGSADPPFDPSDPTLERPQIDPYNEDGNLVIWTGREFYKVKAHERTWVVPPASDSLPSQGQTKVYTVNDVAFDPLRPTRLVSSGNDCALRVWDTTRTADSSFEIQQLRWFNYPNVPNDVVFKPRSSVFAVGCYDGFVYLHHDVAGEPTKLAVANRNSTHKTGTFLWGGDQEKDTGRMHNMLFALSEADDDGEECRHVALDVSRCKEVFTFSCKESGDTMTLNNRSETLAIITHVFGQHTLSIYDVARFDGRRPVMEVPLDTSRGISQLPIEHNFASFSPDGILLALGRTDNVALVYDVRFLSKSRNVRPVARYRHTPREVGAGFGITGLEWVEGFARGSLGLLTAGPDGCVRLWDTAQAPQSESDSTLIAELDHDVACFSLGDTSKGEQRLVVADCGGDVYIYD